MDGPDLELERRSEPCLVNGTLRRDAEMDMTRASTSVTSLGVDEHLNHDGRSDRARCLGHHAHSDIGGHQKPDRNPALDGKLALDECLIHNDSRVWEKAARAY
ncbi:hypothetical protein FRC12_009363 [Ceratobasidium sp. 428]|nr:hypothetical protein FRC12_009363 [Ceratobasidium sp. 428]